MSTYIQGRYWTRCTKTNRICVVYQHHDSGHVHQDRRYGAWPSRGSVSNGERVPVFQDHVLLQHPHNLRLQLHQAIDRILLASTCRPNTMATLPHRHAEYVFEDSARNLHGLTLRSILGHVHYRINIRHHLPVYPSSGWVGLHIARTGVNTPNNSQALSCVLTQSQKIKVL